MSVVTAPLPEIPGPAPTPEAAPPSRDLLPFVLAAVLVTAAVAAMYGPWADIWRFAGGAIGDEESSHIMLIPFVAALLVYLRRDLLKNWTPAPSVVGPLLVAAGWAVSHWGFHHSVQSFWHGGAVLVVLGAVASVLGWRVLVIMWPAVLLLMFVVPVPARVRLPLATKLQAATAAVTAGVLSAFGQGVTRAGNQLLVNGNPVSVVEACNGMRMVFPLLLVVYAFCFCLPLRTPVRWLLILLSPVAAVLCNVLRLIPTVYFFGHANTPSEQAFAQKFHDYAGWPMIAVAFFLLMGVIKLLEWMKVPVTDRKLPSTPPVASPA